MKIVIPIGKKYDEFTGSYYSTPQIVNIGGFEIDFRAPLNSAERPSPPNSMMKHIYKPSLPFFGFRIVRKS